MESFEYKDSFVYVQKYHTGNLAEKIQKTCFCCNKKINNCRGVLLINNYKYIPNVLIHEECFKKWENKKEVLCDNIYTKYRQWKELGEIFG